MRPFAFAALLALPLLGLGAQSASADYYCCGGKRHNKPHLYRVVKDSAIFDCDAHHCETKIRIEGGATIKAKCENGWCRIKDTPFAPVWILESCLERFYDKDEEGKGDEGAEEGAEEDREGQHEGYKRRYHHRGY